MLEIHPYGNYVPKHSKYLLLGSFPTKLKIKRKGSVKGYDWFYDNGVNQFWPILEGVYKKNLSSKYEKQKLFSSLKLSISDIIYSCERMNNNSFDENLINVTYNWKGIGDILRNNKIENIYFTSRFVENSFKKYFRSSGLFSEDTKLIYLPSPSPRNAKIRITEKIKIYSNLLPKV